MIVLGREIATKLVAYIVMAVIIVVLFAGTLRYCDAQRNKAAQSRVEASQAAAARQSSADAINTVSASGERESASEGLSRSNEREIRSAEGADVRVGAGVNVAGLRSLCRRPSYRDDPRCDLFRPSPR